MDCSPATGVELPNELWVEIFKHVDKRSLLPLTLVCKHWNCLIFKYFGHRYQPYLDFTDGKTSEEGVSWIPDRIYRHLHLKWFYPESSTDMDIFKVIAPSMESLKLSQQSLNCWELMHVLKLCPRLNKLCIKGDRKVIDNYNLMAILKVAARIIVGDTTLDLDYKLDVFDKTHTLCRMQYYYDEDDEDEEEESAKPEDPRPIFPSVKSLGLGITDLDHFEKEFLSSVPNVTELEVVLDEPEVNIIKKLAHQLKILKVKVHEDATAEFFALRLPVLEVLVLTLDGKYKNNDLMQFLRGCNSLKTVMIETGNEKEDLFPSIAESLPLVERLQISGETWTALKGLEQMKHLKELALKGCHLKNTYFHWNAKSDPTVEKLECIGVMFHDMVYDLLTRCMNVTHLTLSVRECHDMTEFCNNASWVEEFTLIIDRMRPYIIDQIQENIQGLRKFVIKATIFSEKHFRHLRKLIVLPYLKRLEVEIIDQQDEPVPPISMEVARSVASANRTCMLVLNGERVEPGELQEATGGESPAENEQKEETGSVEESAATE